METIETTLQPCPNRVKNHFEENPLPIHKNLCLNTYCDKQHQEKDSQGNLTGIKYCWRHYSKD